MSAVTPAYLQKVTQEVRFIVEESSSFENGVLRIDEQKLTQAYGPELAQYVAEGIRLLYTDDNLTEEIRATMMDRSFWSCMGSELVGLIPGVDIYQLLTSGD